MECSQCKTSLSIQDLERNKLELQTNLNNLEMYVWNDKYKAMLT